MLFVMLVSTISALLNFVVVWLVAIFSLDSRLCGEMDREANMDHEMEDTFDDGTCANDIVQVDDAYDDVVSFSSSLLRRQNAELGDELDGQYAGIPTSRSDLVDMQVMNDSESDNHEFVQWSDQEDGNDTVEDGLEEHFTESEVESGNDTDDEENVRALQANIIKPSLNMDKAMETQNQVGIWEDLLELQIYVKQCLAEKTVSDDLKNQLGDVKDKLVEMQKEYVGAKVVLGSKRGALEDELRDYYMNTLEALNEALLPNGERSHVFKVVDAGEHGGLNKMIQQIEQRVENEEFVKKKARKMDGSYDDDRFYKLLLQEYIECNGKVNANVNTSLHRKNKNKVDRRASKGRKIRYTVHDKLQNFMYPVPKHYEQHELAMSRHLMASLLK